MITRIALAAAVALPTLSAPQFASAEVFYNDCGFITCRDDSSDAFSERNSTLFDLGIEVANLPMNRPAVLRFMSTLSQRDQYALVLTCTRYLGDRKWVKSRYTIDFCETLLG